MIKALENNTLGMVLASASGVFLLAIVGLIVVWAMPPASGTGDDESPDTGDSVSVATLEETRPLEAYSVVSERPVFNEDRRPAPVLADDEGIDDEIPEEFVGAPDVQLAGIIITPTLRMVTLKSPEHQYSLVAFEGQPLEGDFGTWQVSRIEERSVTLASADGEEMQLELQVHDAVIDAPPESARGGDEEQPESEAGETVAANDQASETMSRAEEIRQRIEERRELLRQAAEAEERGQAESYRDAIQNMIQQGRREEQQAQDAAPDEEEQ